MRRVVIGLLVVWLLSDCQKDRSGEAVGHSDVAKSRQNKQAPPALLKPKDREREYVVLPFGEKPDYVLEGAETAVLTAEDIDEVYRLVQGAVDEYNVKRKRSDNSLLTIDLNHYRLQLISGITAKEEKVVWVNAFCSNLPISWQRSLVVVNDVGKCYFQVNVNLLRKKWYGFGTNGEA